MRLTPRRRAVLAILVSWPVGYFYLSWLSITVENLARHYHGSFPVCEAGWRTYLTPCGLRYDVWAVWTELIGVTVAIVAIGFLAARWVMQPVSRAAGEVAQFGSASLGLRLPEDGPRDEMRRSAEAVNAMLSSLAEGYDAQRRFASNASHELRTPLATQRALIEVSMSSQLTPDAVELLSRQLLATNERNERLVDGLLTLAETDRGLVSASPVRLDAIVSDIMATFQASAEKRQITMTAQLAPAVVMGEAALLERLISNLLQNAIKYNHDGGTVAVEVHEPGTLRVMNSGPLVPPELVPTLFEPFRRASGERLDHGGGVGLGLTIVRSIVNAHRASIYAVPNPGGGMSVDVRFSR